VRGFWHLERFGFRCLSLGLRVVCVVECRPWTKMTTSTYLNLSVDDFVQEPEESTDNSSDDWLFADPTEGLEYSDAQLAAVLDDEDDYLPRAGSDPPRSTFDDFKKGIVDVQYKYAGATRTILGVQIKDATSVYEQVAVDIGRCMRWGDVVEAQFASGGPLPLFYNRLESIMHSRNGRVAAIVEAITNARILPPGYQFPWQVNNVSPLHNALEIEYDNASICMHRCHKRRAEIQDVIGKSYHHCSNPSKRTKLVLDTASKNDEKSEQSENDSVGATNDATNDVEEGEIVEESDSNSCDDGKLSKRSLGQDASAETIRRAMAQNRPLAVCATLTPREDLAKPVNHSNDNSWGYEPSSPSYSPSYSPTDPILGPDGVEDFHPSACNPTDSVCV